MHVSLVQKVLRSAVLQISTLKLCLHLTSMASVIHYASNWMRAQV